MNVYRNCVIYINIHAHSTMKYMQLILKKERNCDICDNVDRPRGYYIKRSKSVKEKLPDVQAGFRKGRETRDQIANIHRIIEKTRDFQKNIYCFIDYTKAFDCVDHNKLWKILQRWEYQTT